VRRSRIRARRRRAADPLRVRDATAPLEARSPQRPAVVAEKLGLRDEGTAERFLQIRGRYEDHIRYAITREEWRERSRELVERFLSSRVADRDSR
jgi:ribosomal-protein-alanine N-acetyltransferase